MVEERDSTQELTPSPGGAQAPATGADAAGTDETIIQPAPGRGTLQPKDARGDADASPSAAPEPQPRDFSDTVQIPAVRSFRDRRGWLGRWLRKGR